MTDKTIFKAPGFLGRVTGVLGEMMIIDADLDGEIDSHVATGDEFAIVVSGLVHVTKNGETSRYGPGEYLVISTGVEHGIVAEEPSRLILIWKP